MKRFLSVTLMASLFTALSVSAQKPAEDKSKRPSPPARVSETIASGAVITIDYSAPSVKGRTIGKDLEPRDKNVWRAGANEATVFEVSKDVMVEGKALPAGKYGFFTIIKGTEWFAIFNKVWSQWGAFNYKESEDALRVPATVKKSATFTETLKYTISKSGKVTLLWGDNEVSFQVK